MLNINSTVFSTHIFRYSNLSLYPLRKKKKQLKRMENVQEKNVAESMGPGL